MEAPKLILYTNGQHSLSHSMRYCIEYELWAEKGPLTPAHLSERLGKKYRSHYSKANLANRLTEMVNRGAAHKLARGLYVHDAHYARVRAESEMLS